MRELGLRTFLDQELAFRNFGLLGIRELGFRDFRGGDVGFGDFRG